MAYCWQSQCVNRFRIAKIYMYRMNTHTQTRAFSWHEQHMKRWERNHNIFFHWGGCAIDIFVTILVENDICSIRIDIDWFINDEEYVKFLRKVRLTNQHLACHLTNQRSNWINSKQRQVTSCCILALCHFLHNIVSDISYERDLRAFCAKNISQ